ncbi:MAG TPA: GNAT family N-acetyltransferase [Oscillospiraceae bacterium]|nr:GNAT family N-acetyltransferase [Oscillospiraceae bacterium]HPS34557.1 GNAT family N-acetyltransferase [Oscillospiraceae bacterium]
MGTIIRDLVMEDMAQLAALHEQFWGDKSDVERMKSEFPVIMQENRHIILVAERDGIVIGSVMGIVCRELYGDCRPFMVVEDMVVDRQSRRGGIGFQLLTELEKRARERNCAQMLLVTEADRIAACGLYEKYGFQKNNKGYKKKLI